MPCEGYRLDARLWALGSGHTTRAAVAMGVSLEEFVMEIRWWALPRSETRARANQGGHEVNRWHWSSLKGIPCPLFVSVSSVLALLLLSLADGFDSGEHDDRYEDHGPERAAHYFAGAERETRQLIPDAAWRSALRPRFGSLAALDRRLLIANR